MTLTFGSLFAGIGGFDLGFERAGMVCKWQVEIDDFCNKVLEKHWPDVRRYRDVREVGKHNLEAVDVICGGFPCQPFSTSGNIKGTNDDRFIWPEMLRIIEELSPNWIVAENVLNFKNVYLDEALSELENLQYKTETIVLPACGFNAQHKRYRIFIIANSTSERCNAWKHKEQSKQGYYEQRIDKSTTSIISDRWRTKPIICGGADGIPNRVDRLRALGNAVVPQVAEWIGRQIVEVEGQCSPTA